MEQSKLVIVCGMSGSGKSTSSKRLAQLYRQNGHDCRWYHEEMAAHPIRGVKGGEFSVAERSSTEGMRRNMDDYYRRWENFLQDLDRDPAIHVMEGCVFQNIIRYFFPNASPDSLIDEFYQKLFALLQTRPVSLVFLHCPDVEATLQAAFAQRGDGWKRLILDPAGDSYFDTHPYTGDDSIFAMWAAYQRRAAGVFTDCTLPKLELTVHSGDGRWEQRMASLSAFLGLTYFPPAVYIPEDPGRYCGVLFDSDGKATGLRLLRDGQTLGLSCSWWRFMTLTARSSTEFELASFPVTLHFAFDRIRTAVRFEGTYDWDLNGKTLYLAQEAGA